MTVIQFPAQTAENLSAVITVEVRTLMGRYNVTQAMLAEWLDRSKAAISERMHGKTRWSIEDVERIAEGFSVHPAVLLGGRPEGPLPGPGEGLPILRACRDSNPKPSDSRSGALRLVEVA